MALVLADRVLETTTTTGSGTITLAGAEPGYQSFSAVGNGNQTYYTITADTVWEVGIGTYTASGTTLSRDTVLSSSASGAKVTLPSGVKKVFVTYPSEKSVNLDVSGNISLSSAVISGVGYPSANSDAATKLYVDTLAAEGISYHTPVKYEVPNTTGNLTATYNNGTAGVSATLTNAGTLGPFVPDGVTASISDRVLIYNQTNGYENGVYVVTTVGTGASSWVLTRAADADTYGVKSPTALGTGDAFYVTSGNTGAGETYVCNTPGTIVFGSTNITFVQVSAAQVYQAGTGISLTNTTISLVSPVAVATGGTGTTGTPTNGQLLIGNGSGYTLSTLTAGTGVSITNSAGSITLTATGTGGTVVAVTATAPLASTGGVSPNISIANSTGTGSVVLDQGATISSATITAGVSAAITTITGTSANITTVTGTTAGFSSANISTLSSTSANITTLTGTSATITTITGTSSNISTLSSNSANITTLSSTNANFTSATITNLALTSITLSNLSVSSANITTLTGASATITTIIGTSSNITTLSSTSANITTLTGTTFGTTATTQLRGASGAITTLSGTTATFTSATVTNLALTSLTITSLSITNLAASSATITTGNLAFTGTAQRITGDMSNATVSNRLAFQNSTTNGNTSVYALPNGTATAAQYVIVNNSDPTNASTAQLFINNTETRLVSTITGTGTYLPMTFVVGGSERMRLDTSGNLGIGTNSPNQLLQIEKSQNSLTGINIYNANAGASAEAGVYMRNNTSGSSSGGGAYVTLTSGNTLQVWNVFGNPITFGTNNAERMRIDSSGNVGIGTSTANKSSSSTALTVNTGTAANYSAVEWSSNNTLNYHINANDSAIYHVAAGTRPWIVYTNGTERMRIDSSGNVGIGGTANSFAKVEVTGNFPGTTAGIGHYVNATVPSGMTANAQGFRTNIGTAAASFTLNNLFHFYAVQGAIGATSAVTNQYGFHAHSSLIGATNNYGFYSDIASGSNRWNFYAAGTAANYFAGLTSVGTTVAGGFNGTFVLGGSGSPTSGFLEGIHSNQLVPSSVTTRYDAFLSSPSTASASFTVGSIRHYAAQQGTFNSPSAVTSQYGFFVDSGLTGATNNFGFYSDIAFASNRWNFYANGTADNYFAGNVGINNTAPAARLHVIAPNTTAASLTWNATSGQIFRNENSEFAFGLSSSSPYPLYIQGRTSSSTARDISINPVGGNVGIGRAPSVTLDVNGPIYSRYTAGWGVAALYMPGGYSQFGKENGYRTDIVNTGGLDANNPFWIGYQWCPPDVITNSSAQNSFPRTSFYFNYSTVTNPSNMTWNMYVGNTNGVPISYNIGTESAGAINMITSGNTRMTVTSGGNVGIGTTSPGGRLHVNNSDSAETNPLVISNNISGIAIATAGAQFVAHGVEFARIVGGQNQDNTFADGNLRFFTRNSETVAERVRITTSGGLGVGTTANPGAGAIYATGNITAYYSDARLKDFKGKIDGALDKISQLNGYYYTENAKAEEFGYNNKTMQVGVSAQEVQAVLPEVVSTAPFDMDENNQSKSGENYMTVNYEKLVPLLIEAIKELKAEVEALKASKS